MTEPNPTSIRLTDRNRAGVQALVDKLQLPRNAVLNLLLSEALDARAREDERKAAK